MNFRNIVLKVNLEIVVKSNLYMKKIFIIYLLLLLSACKNQDNNNENIKEDEFENVSDKKEELIFLSDVEVENMIREHENIFLSSYWAGMSKQQAVEITRYLLDKNMLYGKFFNANSDDSKYISQKSLNIDTFEITDWRYSLKTLNYFLDADIRFNFNNSNELEGVSLWIIDVDKEKYIELVEIFKKKYGAPTRIIQNRNESGPFKYSKDNAEYTFIKGNQMIRVEYRPKNSGFEGLESKFNEIYIMYDDLLVIEKNTKESRERMKNEKIKMENNRKKEIENSLEKI